MLRERKWRAYVEAHHVTPVSKQQIGSLAASNIMTLCPNRQASVFVEDSCWAQVLICSCCDRGQIYCAQGCAKECRRSAQRAAGQRYQSSYRGRLKHAAQMTATDCKSAVMSDAPDFASNLR
jgi:hypothetical protein